MYVELFEIRQKYSYDGLASPGVSWTLQLLLWHSRRWDRSTQVARDYVQWGSNGVVHNMRVEEFMHFIRWDFASSVRIQLLKHLLRIGKQMKQLCTLCNSHTIHHGDQQYTNLQVKMFERLTFIAEIHTHKKSRPWLDYNAKTVPEG